MVGPYFFGLAPRVSLVTTHLFVRFPPTVQRSTLTQIFFIDDIFFLTRQTDVGKKLELLAVRQKLKLCVPHEE